MAPEWLVGGGYFQRRRDIDDARPCHGASEVEHSHFFTADGRFGSYDENGEEVDHGHYTIVDATTLKFPTHAKELGGAVTVRYRVQGDTLAFEVVAPDPCTGGCRMATAWALSAFYPGAFDRSGETSAKSFARIAAGYRRLPSDTRRVSSAILEIRRSHRDRHRGGEPRPTIRERLAASPWPGAGWRQVCDRTPRRCGRWPTP